MKQHLSQDELLDRLYGLSDGDVPHLRECEECSSRYQAMERRRVEAAGELPVANEFLATQRRAIYGRLGQAPAAHSRWAPAVLAVAFLLVMGVFLVHPHSQYRPAGRPDPVAAVDLSDAQLFSDLYSMEQSVEPRAAAPIHALFEAPEGESEQ
jgi:hypothetical protein